MDPKKSVLLYTDWLEPLQTLAMEQVGQLFCAILHYTETGIAPEFQDPAAQMAFSFIRLRLDDNLAKWEQTRSQRSQAGRKGGSRPKRRAAPEIAPEPVSAQANASFACSEQAKQANQAVPVPVPAPVPVPVPAPVPVPEPVPAPAPEQQENGLPLPPLLPPHTEGPDESAPEQEWTRLGLGEQAKPMLRQALEGYRRQGLEDALLLLAVQEAAAHEAKHPLPYLRSILDRCAAQHIRTAADWKATRPPSGAAVRVSRPMPAAGADFLQSTRRRPMKKG